MYDLGPISGNMVGPTGTRAMGMAAIIPTAVVPAGIRTSPKWTLVLY